MKESNYDTWKSTNPADYRPNSQNWKDSLDQSEFEEIVYEKLDQLSDNDEIDELLKILKVVSKKHIGVDIAEKLKTLIHDLDKNHRSWDIYTDIFEMYQEELWKEHGNKYDKDHYKDKY